MQYVYMILPAGTDMPEEQTIEAASLAAAQDAIAPMLHEGDTLSYCREKVAAAAQQKFYVVHQVLPNRSEQNLVAEKIIASATSLDEARSQAQRLAETAAPISTRYIRVQGCKQVIVVVNHNNQKLALASFPLKQKLGGGGVKVYGVSA